MNSWHSFSPDGRWMVFSSKSRSPYTQMFLTHIGEAGSDSPAILIENATAANRAVNIPEFINIQEDGIAKIDAPVTDYYRVVDVATELMKKGQNEAAAAEWRKAIELNPNEAQAHNNLGVMLAETGKPDEAIEHYRKAVELSPEYPEAHNNLGEALITKRRLDEAIVHFAKAIELNPKHASAYSNLGAALAQQGKLQEAIPYLQKAVEYKPEPADVQNNLGIALAMTGRMEEAIPPLEKALAARPQSFEAHVVLGRVLAATKRFREAIPHFEQAIKISGGQDASLLAFFAGVCAEAGRFPDAAAAARRSIAVAAGQGKQELADQVKARLRYYEAGRNVPPE
jgi:tetratricopeptide (TPR) repeat protein